jgi:hypothetical protein
MKFALWRVTPWVSCLRRLPAFALIEELVVIAISGAR